MPRLLSLNNYHYRRGGAEAVYFDHEAMFRGIGWDTAFFSMHHPKNFASDWSRFFVEEIEFGEAYGALDKMRKAAKVIYSFEARARLRELLDTFKADVAHAHCIYHHLSPAVLPVLKQRGIATVMTAHDLKLACPAYRMLNAEGICERCKSGNLLNVVIHKCIHESRSASAVIAAESILHRALNTYRGSLDRVVVPSRFYGRKLAEWGWPQEKLVYIPNFIDLARFSPSSEVGDDLLYLGRLGPEKGLLTLIRAVAKTSARLKIVGAGPQEAELRREAAPLGARVAFLGYQTGAALDAIVAGARAVVLPSEWYENAPMSVLESFAAGKVVIGADIGGIPELLEGQPRAFLFESGNAEALAGSIDTLLATPAASLIEIGRANRAVAETFSLERYRASMLDMYRTLGVA